MYHIVSYLLLNFLCVEFVFLIWRGSTISMLYLGIIVKKKKEKGEEEWNGDTHAKKKKSNGENNKG